MSIERATARIVVTIVLLGLVARALGAVGCTPVALLALGGGVALMAWVLGVWMRRMA